MERWKRINLEDRKEATIENVPNEVIKKALDIATVYEECPKCGTRQFLEFMPGHNTEGECKNCGFTCVI